MPDGAVRAIEEGVNGFFVPGDGIVDFARDGWVVGHGRQRKNRLSE